MKSPILFFTILITILSSCKKDDVKNNSEECYSNTNAQTLVHASVHHTTPIPLPFLLSTQQMSVTLSVILEYCKIYTIIYQLISSILTSRGGTTNTDFS